jgi:NADH-quinone oxidoreductase subunit L
MENYLDPVFRTTNRLIEERKFIVLAEEHGAPIGAYVQAWVLALIGGGIAFFLYRVYFPKNPGLPAPLKALQKLSFNKFYIDEIYTFLFVRPVTFLSRLLFRVVDAVLIDGVGVRGTAWVTARTGAVLRYLQTGDAQSYAAVMAFGLAAGLLWALFKVMP